MASEKLRRFLEENFNWDDEEDADHIVTEAVIIYRRVSVIAEGDELPEIVDYVSSRSCAFTMAVGMVYQVQCSWDYEFIKKLDGDEDDGEED